MCKAFSGLVNISGKVTWKFGVDSHTDLVKLAGYKDNCIDPTAMEFAKFEITPKNNNYLHPDEWVYRVDESPTPYWVESRHEGTCWKAHKHWLRQLNKILVNKPIVDPFKIVPPGQITAKHVRLLQQWDSVRDSVGDSVGDSVRYSVGHSVWDSVHAYIGSFFKLSTWKYVKHSKGVYPFQSAVDLWEMGLMPTSDGNEWRLHAGPHAKVVFQISQSDLEAWKPTASGE